MSAHRPPVPPICADTGTAKWPGNCWNVRCQLGGTCCRASRKVSTLDLLQMLHECAEYIAALNGEQDDYCQRARALIARATGEVK